MDLVNSTYAECSIYQRLPFENTDFIYFVTGKVLCFLYWIIRFGFDVTCTRVSCCPGKIDAFAKTQE